MAYALSTSYEGKRLQIDALDGLFGGNATYSRDLNDGKIFLRLRFLHNSAHMVDGHYDLEKDQWIDNRFPVPFARDFGEITVAHQIEGKDGVLRYYGSGAYSVLVRPSALKRFIFNGGFEISTPNLTGNVFGHQSNLFAAYHFTLNGTSNYTAGNNLMAGVKFGKWSAKGIVFYLSYYSGNNMFSEYYSEKINRFGAGFTVEMF